MTERFPSFPDDEPVIGANTPPRSPRYSSSPVIGEPSGPVIGQDYPLSGDDWDEAASEQDGYAEDEDEYGEYEDGYEDEGYYDDYYDDSPARQPLFYVFLALAAVVGGIFIYLLYSIATGDGGDEGGNASAQFSVRMDQPVDGEHVDAAKDMTIAVTATSNEPITLFELFVQDKAVDQQAVSTNPPDNIYTAAFTWKFTQKNTYKIFVRVHSQSGATKDTPVVKVLVFEGVGEKPVSINGKVSAQASVRVGPQENAESVGTLTAGQQVKVLGKTSDQAWLLIEFDGQQRWVKRDAIEVQESLSLVPRKDPTPVPQPTATNTTAASPSPTPSPSPGANAPDFAPTSATLIEVDGQQVLRVTVANLSTNTYEGPLEVSAANVDSGTITKAFGVRIIANGSQTVDLPVSVKVTSDKNAQVKIDPANAVKEQNEDNNAATFVVKPTVESPDLSISAAAPGTDKVNVTVKNEGGTLPESQVTVKVTVGGNAAEQTKSIALTKNQTAEFAVNKPGSGNATIEVFLNGTKVASQQLEIP